MKVPFWSAPTQVTRRTFCFVCIMATLFIWSLEESKQLQLDKNARHRGGFIQRTRTRHHFPFVVATNAASLERRRRDKHEDITSSVRDHHPYIYRMLVEGVSRATRGNFGQPASSEDDKNKNNTAPMRKLKLSPRVCQTQP